jgi:hypothetical protein
MRGCDSERRSEIQVVTDSAFFDDKIETVGPSGDNVPPALHPETITAIANIANFMVCCSR